MQGIVALPSHSANTPLRHHTQQDLARGTLAPSGISTHVTSVDGVDDHHRVAQQTAGVVRLIVMRLAGRVGGSVMSIDRWLMALYGTVALVLPASSTMAHTKANAACPVEQVLYDPGNGEDIAVPKGYKVSVFAQGLNFPTGIAFRGDKHDFQILVVESGTGLPSACNNNELPAFGGKFSATNPFTPDLLIFDKNGKKVGGPIGKPTGPGVGYQADGPAIGLAFEHGFRGGMLFGTDSNQGARGAPGKATTPHAWCRSISTTKP